MLQIHPLKTSLVFFIVMLHLNNLEIYDIAKVVFNHAVGYMSVSFKINTSVMQIQSNFVSYIIFNLCGSLHMYVFRGRNLILLQNCNFFT